MTATSEEPTLSLSVIIPCYNEEGSLEEAVASVRDQLSDRFEKFEILLVNDGSKDNTYRVASQLEESYPEVVLLDHMRNFGQTQAYQTGFDYAQGKSIILYSADMETPPEMILHVIEKLEAGYDFVNTLRKDRWSPLHALKSKLANGILNRISKVEIHDRGSGLKGLRWEIAKAFTLYGEWHRFLPDYATLYTDRIVEIEVPFAERKAGESSYKGRMKSVSVFLDLATVGFFLSSHRKPFGMLPGRLFGFTGTLLTVIGGFISLWLVGQKLFFGETLSNRPLFLVGILLGVLGVIMIMVGVLGELLLLISHRQQNPRAFIRKNRSSSSGESQ